MRRTSSLVIFTLFILCACASTSGIGGSYEIQVESAQERFAETKSHRDYAERRAEFRREEKVARAAIRDSRWSDADTAIGRMQCLYGRGHVLLCAGELGWPSAAEARALCAADKSPGCGVGAFGAQNPTTTVLIVPCRQSCFGDVRSIPRP